MSLSLACVSAHANADDRSMDGSGNNTTHFMMGMAGTDMTRGASGAHYADGLGAPLLTANPRAISNAVSAQTLAGLGNSRGLSSMAWQWGQFIDHDFSLVLEGTEPMDFPIPTGDPVFDPGATGTAVMPFNRSVCTGGISGPRQHQNAITHWLDGSGVYGSDAARAAALRSGVGGRLATSAGNMLPFNTAGLPNAGGPSPTFFLAGDIRANEQTGLTAMHTVFMREHNRLADAISAANPGWSDEQVYQKARKIVGAEIQAITYNEWLPALTGGNGLGSYSGYDPTQDGSVNTAFATAAFRIGHSMLNDQLQRFNADGTVFAGGHLSLFQSFFNPSSIQGPGNLEAVLRGLGIQESNEIDTQAIDGVRNLLFGGTNGRDLIALNLQRGRDHGIPDYNTMREDFGLSRVSSFSEITSDAALAAAMQSVFGDVDHIDAWIGLFAEDHLAGGSMGETATAIFNDQFGRLRAADRYFYLNDSDLGASELAFLDGLTLAEVIRLNTGATDVQDTIFFAVPSPGTLALAPLGMLMAWRRRRV
ncbi:MAG: peroxidase family protein [Phycisphaerales bacterium]